MSKVLFVNLPFLETRNGQLWTGPNAGSCWPHTVPGLYSYVPFPFWMANAVTYLRNAGHEATLFDAWAYRHTNMPWIFRECWEQFGHDVRADIVVLECSTPTYELVNDFAKQLKDAMKCKIVITGQHMAAYGDEVSQQDHVDHVIKGELELPMLEIVGGSTHKVFKTVVGLEDINFAPYRDPNCFANYCDPSMPHQFIQLQVNGSRGCPWRCSYCAWPQTSYANYRLRSAESILTEIAECCKNHLVSSIFFDDETWGLGPKDRLRDLCYGLQKTHLPWSIMTRSDTWTQEEMMMFQACGCTGARFGVESTHQHLLDRVDKKLDVKKSLANINWLLTHSKGFQARLLTMKKLPGETPEEEAIDAAKWAELKLLGERHGNRVDIQVADCTPLPGTKLWKQMQDAGQSDKMQDFNEFQPHPDHGGVIAEKLNRFIPITVSKEYE